MNSITVGLSGIESLSSYLARKAKAADAPGAEGLSVEDLEETFEAMVLAPRLDLDRPDAYAALGEARHDHAFVGVAGGSRWTVRTKGPALTADAAHAPPAVHGSADDTAASLLAELNRNQQTLDRLARQQNSLSQQLYADWCVYLLCKYPPRGSVDDYPHADDVRRHIELSRLAKLEVNIVEWRRLLGLVTGSTIEVISALTEADVARLEVTAADVSDWDRLEAALGVLGVSAKILGQVDPADEAAHRANLLDVVNRLIADDPVPASVLAGITLGSPLDPTMQQWLHQPPPTAADLLDESAPVRHQIFGRDDDPTNDHQQQWLDHLTASVGRWHRTVRARAVIEVAAKGALKAAAKARHHLEVLPGPRFWAPRDPVVLLDGPAVTRSPRRPWNDTAASITNESWPFCSVMPIGPDPAAWLPRAVTSSGTGFNDFAAEIRTLVRELPGGNIGSTQAVDWHPVHIDWKATVRDHVDLGNNNDGSSYAADYVLQRFALPTAEPDVSDRRRPIDPNAGRSFGFSGRARLSGHVTSELTDAVSRLAPPADPADPTAFNRLCSWAVDHLNGNEQNLQALSLTGFNIAHLAHQSIMSLPIRDPLAFTESREFGQRVARAVGRHTTMAPTPLGVFRPISAGELTIDRLRAIDSFGRMSDLDVAAAGAESTTLPARVVPPARLHIRWQAARGGIGVDGEEAHDHPTTGPICGWLVPNVLEGRIMVYRSSGEAIGSIDDTGGWRPPPGVDRYTPPNDIANAGLRQVVLQLLHESVAGRGRLLEQFMESLETIEPDSHAQHRALALLMGRPIAVVRASMRLEMLGHPPVAQSWDSYRSQLKGGPADTAGLSDVRFPIRIGEPGQLDDGVVGFWVERDSDTQGNGTRFDGPLRTPQLAASATADAPATEDGSPTVGWAGWDGTIGSAGGHLDLTLDGDTIHLTVLLDPRGRFHATTGILPTKVLDIPHEQYATALDTIGVTFLTSPLLCDPGTIQVALPSEPGYAWSWLERSTDGWTETAGSDIGAPTVQAHLTGQQQIREGWLKLVPVPTDGGDSL